MVVENVVAENVVVMMEAQDGTEPIELTARVVARQGRFVAAVHGLELEGSGSTPAAAEEALVQAMRNWLERQDTAGRLAESLGVEYLDEETEIVLQFVADGDEAGDDEADGDEGDG